MYPLILPSRAPKMMVRLQPYVNRVLNVCDSGSTELSTVGSQTAKPFHETHTIALNTSDTQFENPQLIYPTYHPRHHEALNEHPPPSPVRRRHRLRTPVRIPAASKPRHYPSRRSRAHNTPQRGKSRLNPPCMEKIA